MPGSAYNGRLTPLIKEESNSRRDKSRTVWVTGLRTHMKQIILQSLELDEADGESSRIWKFFQHCVGYSSSSRIKSIQVVGERSPPGDCDAVML